MVRAPAIILHVVWIVPFILGYFFGGLAALLLVGLPYIKVKKLKAMIQGLEEQVARSGSMRAGESSAALQYELASLQKTLKFWRSLTFLPD